MKISKHPSLLYAKEIADICNPLQKLNINYFGHVRIDNKKNLSAIGCHAEFSEHYLTNQYYTTDIHMVDHGKFGDFFVWDGIEFSGKSGQMCYEAGQFGIHNPFTIIRKNKTGVDYYHFASNSVNKQVNQVYLANYDLLNLFISHFNEHVNQSKALSKAYDLKINLGAIGAQKKAFEDENIICERDEFLQVIKATHISKLQLDNAILSKRQTEILRLAVMGKTIKEISKTLGLSPRTVGHYFDTVKMKFNVSSRSELISKAMEERDLFNFIMRSKTNKLT